ncbi:hypothetical protein F5Y10DRAFT_281496 [Nemania abortiva]|nr:hypothetical protein F5Y10DRAFT_281496 [Nemania abortiva]
MSSPDPIQAAFESAKDVFKKRLDNDELFKDLLETSSIEDVWALAEKLQKQPYIERRMRHMAKISGFLDKLQVYTSTIDTFVSAKPEILALIWGPIRLLLSWTANDAKFSDAITSAMEKIGNALPQFGEMSKIFSESTKLGQVMALFFQDILEFYTITLNFFRLPRRRQFFEAIWPRQKERIDLVAKQLEQHTVSMKDEVTLLHIRAEHEARTRSLALFDQAAEAQQLQRFQALKMEVSPQTYSDRLDWLVNRSSQGSADWLRNDKAFIDWLNISNRTARLLWLRGIPGAGKTFLAAAAVEETRSRNNTLFAFASHLQPTCATARSILQSLVFQLAYQSKDAQAILVGSGARDISSHSKDVSSLLNALLIDSGPIFIVVDGLDEMEVEERRTLLQQLVGMDGCPETRILLSSRPEDDIVGILDTKAISIYVDKRNSNSIEAYVRHRARSWIENGNFDQQAQKEIQSLLNPIAARAQGMFLYARIILDNAELLTDCQEIERELKVLPLDLNDAYQRILSRINGLPTALRRKARTILGWIGCSPTPMTVHEMEQALLVDIDSKVAPSIRAPMRFVQICGPIVEVVGESPQFVHFTVKEYIFSQQITRSINMSEAYRDLALSTLTYLSSDIVNVKISDERIRNNILDGKYRLYSFATGQWIPLALRCMRESKNPSTSIDLQALLLWLAITLKNDEFDDQTDSPAPTFQYSESRFPEIAQIIDAVLHFRRNELQTEWNYTNSSTWVNADPTIISTISVRFHDQFESLLCNQRQHKDPCYCETLRRHYGANIFKCIFPSCRFNREGFQTRRSCRDHIEMHSRPWKCSKSSCLYASVGFLTRNARDDHLRKEHTAPQEPINLPPGQFTIDDERALLYELTKNRDIDQLKEVSTKLHKFELRGRGWLMAPARQLAAMMGSLPMVRILTDYDAEYNPFADEAPLCRAVVRSENLDLFRWVLDSFRSTKRISTWNYLASEILVTKSPEMYSEWEGFLLDPLRTIGSLPQPAPQMAMTLIPEYHKRYVLFSSIAFNAVKKNVMYEERLIRTWHRLIDDIGPLNPQFLGFSLTRLAMSSKPSIKLGAELLRLGALIDFPRGNVSAITEGSEAKAYRQADTNSRHARGLSPLQRPYQGSNRGKTALHYAAQGTSEEAANFVQFLLAQGANPNYGYADRKPNKKEREALMREWLGETREELAERTLESMDLQNTEEQEEEADDPPTRESRGRAKRRRMSDDGEEGNVCVCGMPMHSIKNWYTTVSLQLQDATNVITIHTNMPCYLRYFRSSYHSGVSITPSYKEI